MTLPVLEGGNGNDPWKEYNFVYVFPSLFCYAQGMQGHYLDVAWHLMARGFFQDMFRLFFTWRLSSSNSLPGSTTSPSTATRSSPASTAPDRRRTSSPPSTSSRSSPPTTALPSRLLTASSHTMRSPSISSTRYSAHARSSSHAGLKHLFQPQFFTCTTIEDVSVYQLGLEGVALGPPDDTDGGGGARV
ncbi:hypothetical protein MSAN_00285900 [Mycena sanguinolenta]|uniref:Uncharacterized protein n=1 Tax=Mycena sanguinolenta TaxID=230812 RepID=A0A8H7DJZ5_9AGAR|nr:hypothetical protein MSAN_00285900 [Mycena sanguinolenta]